MNEREFHKRLKQILVNTKHEPYDSPPEEFHDVFHGNVIQKSGGVWDESIAAEEMKQIEWAFDVQPEAVMQAGAVKEDDVISALESFLKLRGYTYQHIEESNRKTPEGYIIGAGEQYLCEVKSPLLRFDHRATPFGYKFATTQQKILSFIHTVIKQFESQDPNHTLPHILIYTSAHMQLHWKSFLDAINGGVIGPDGKLAPDLRFTKVYQNTKDIVYSIDGYAWFQIGSAGEFHQASYFINNDSKYSANITKLCSNLSKVKVSSMDNLIAMQRAK